MRSLFIVPALALATAHAALAQTDARSVLAAAQEAIRDSRGISYTGEFKGTGALAGAVPHVSGHVQLARLTSARPLGAQVRIEGQTTPAAKGEPVPFQFVFDGDRVHSTLPAPAAPEAPKDPVTPPKPRSKPPRDKKATEPAGQEPGERDDLLARDEMRLFLPEFAFDDALQEQIAAGVLKLEAPADIGGVTCDVVTVEYLPSKGVAGRPPQTLHVRWSIGRDDHLPRRFEQLAKVAGGGTLADSAVALTLTDVKTGQWFDRTVFAPPAATAPAPDAPRKPLPPLIPRKSLLAVNAPAPDWQLPGPDGKPVRLSDMRGKVVLLDFWATWCGPCKAVMPEIQEIHNRFDDGPVAVFGVNAWERDGDPAAYMKQQQYTYGLLLKGDDVAGAYGVTAIPTFYVIGPDGKVLYRKTGAGAGEKERIIKVIESALKKLGN